MMTSKEFAKLIGVSQLIEDMVPRACKLLMELIEKKEILIQDWIKPRLILRDTTRDLF